MLKKYSENGWHELKHWMAVLMKQVFPKLYRPTRPSEVVGCDGIVILGFI